MIFEPESNISLEDTFISYFVYHAVLLRLQLFAFLLSVLVFFILSLLSYHVYDVVSL